MSTSLSSLFSSVQRGYIQRSPLPAGLAERSDGVSTNASFSLLEPDDTVDLGETDEASGDINENPAVQRYSREKSQALEAFERLKEELKIVRKVWANDPEELAAQLVRLGKELAKLVKQYQKAQKALAEVLGKQSGMSLTMPSLSASSLSVAPETTQTPEDADITAPDELDNGIKGSEALPSNAQQSEGLAIYQKMTGTRVRLDQTPFALSLRGDIEFAQGFRAFATELREILEYSQKQSPNLPGHTKDREERMDDAHEFLEDLEKELFKYVGDLKRAMPPAVYLTVPTQVG